MLYCMPYEKMAVKECFRAEGALWLILEHGMQKLVPVDEGSIRILYTKRESFSHAEKPGIVELPSFEDWTYEEAEEKLFLRMKELWVEIDKRTNQFRYLDGEGRLLLAEKSGRSKELEEFPVYRMLEEDAQKEYVDTPDGMKEVVREASRVQVGSAYHTRLHLCFEDEALYGLGQHEEGYHSLRGQRVYLYQGNRRIAIPMLVSTKGYGILVNTYAPAVFNDTAEGSYFYTEADPEMDFFFLNGRRLPQEVAEQGTKDIRNGCETRTKSMDRVIAAYRRITGKAVMLPKWAFGYMQSQERYESQEEILSVAGEYRKRGIGLDCIVLDWCSWKDGEWGQKSFDPDRFPDPDDMTKKLHEEHVHFMVSIWPNLTEGTSNYEEFREKGLLLPGINNYNPLGKEGREVYWKQAREGLYCHGVDAWWCDNSEPFTPEWNHRVRPENSRSYEEYCNTAAYHMDATMTNTYGFFHAQAIYEGQRGIQAGKTTGEGAEIQADKSQIREAAKATQMRETANATQKRVVNLTRSGYIGQQRFGTILWSGDISASWDTLRRQIAAGLHFCASGLPYWTVDIGAFFVKNGAPWFWDGQYDLGPKDPAYCELFTRWYQWGAFLPIFRGHGTDFRRELWEFDHPVAPFYEALLKANHLRYELMPYLYSLAGNVWLEDGSMIKPLSFAFSEDKETWNIMDQYLLGNGMMVCPVVRPLYFGERDEVGNDGNNPETAPRLDPQRKDCTTGQIRVYLPAGCTWFDFWTNRSYKGGQWITADAPLEHIPVFVKAGTILPHQPFAQSVEEQTEDITLTVYDGADGSFMLYEDAGDGYGYELGQYSITEIEWNALKQELLVNGAAEHTFKTEVIKAGEVVF